MALLLEHISQPLRQLQYHIFSKEALLEHLSTTKLTSVPQQAAAAKDGEHTGNDDDHWNKLRCEASQSNGDEPTIIIWRYRFGENSQPGLKADENEPWDYRVLQKDSWFYKHWKNNIIDDNDNVIQLTPEQYKKLKVETAASWFTAALVLAIVGGIIWMGAPFIIPFFATFAGSLILCAILAGTALVLYGLIVGIKARLNTGVWHLSPLLDAIALFWKAGLGALAWTAGYWLLALVIIPALGVGMAALSTVAWPVVALAFGLGLLMPGLFAAWRHTLADSKTKTALASVPVLSIVAIAAILGATGVAAWPIVIAIATGLLIVGLCGALGVTAGNTLWSRIASRFKLAPQDPNWETKAVKLFTVIAFLGAAWLLLSLVVTPPVVAILLTTVVIAATLLVCYFRRQGIDSSAQPPGIPPSPEAGAGAQSSPANSEEFQKQAILKSGASWGNRDVGVGSPSSSFFHSPQSTTPTSSELDGNPIANAPSNEECDKIYLSAR